MDAHGVKRHFYGVAPYTGAWIEICRTWRMAGGHGVAPYTGAWIEIPCTKTTNAGARRRSLHGSVD